MAVFFRACGRFKGSDLFYNSKCMASKSFLTISRKECLIVYYGKIEKAISKLKASKESPFKLIKTHLEDL